MRKRIFILSLIGFAAMLRLQAQAITVPFVCDFEDPQELSAWTLNTNTANAADRWVVGTATYFDATHSLYITSTADTAAQYGYAPNVVMAYRTIRFPQGRYNISFDWKCEGDEQKAKCYVFVGPKGLLTTGLYTDGTNNYGLQDVLSETVGTLPNRAVNRFSKLTDGTTQHDYLCGSMKWQNYYIQGDAQNPETSINISATQAQQDYILAFVWVNAQKDSVENRLGACIDNLQIASATIKKPTNLQAEVHCEDSTLLLTWQSGLAYHDIEYKDANATLWRHITNIPAATGSAQSYRLPVRMEGSYSIRIKGYQARGGEASAYTALNNVVYWCPDNHCINYIDLTDATCRYGTWGTSSTPNPQEPGVIDYGEEAMESRHTVNWIENRYDPRTRNSFDASGRAVAPLKTIPDGYQASVRLGNWNNGSECESVTYEFVVDSVSQAILLMKYAIVFENPGHPGKQCSFRIVVLDENDKPIDPTCGRAEFTFDDAAKWNYSPKTAGSTHEEIYWKDWTTIGLDMRRYHGRTLRVRVTNADCGQGGHFGYSYFVLDCASASIETDNCGADSEIEVIAPDGFNYTWTDSKGQVVSTDRILRADAGYEVYTCEACMKEAGDCCFSLSTDFAPRYPAPQFSWKQTPSDCKNYVQFTNESHVLTRYDDHDKHTSEACDQVNWELEWASGGTVSSGVENPKVECSPDGDTLYVALRAVLGGGKCDSVLLDTIVVPSIRTKDSTIVANLCEGDTYIFAQQGYTEAGIYQDLQTNWAGCDSLTILDLRVHQKSDTVYLNDTVCSTNLPYVLNGLSYLYSDTYSQTLLNEWNCDSVVQLSLIVVDKVEVAVDSLPTLCANEGELTIQFAVLQNRFDSLAIRFFSSQPQEAFYDQMIYDNSLTAVQYPFAETILPDHYRVQLEFYQHAACGNQVYDLDFDIRYQASIVEQKWNDVLALLNATYNGGYTFTAYQWYKNETPIEGAMLPYLYQPLDMQADYSVLLTREDGVAVRSCPIRPTTHTDSSAFPTIAKVRQRITLRRGETENALSEVRIYSVVGQLYSLTPLSGDEYVVTAPAEAGNYLVERTDTAGQTTTQRLIVVE